MIFSNNCDLRARARRGARKSWLFDLSNCDLSTSNVDIPDTSNCDLGASNGHVSDSSNLDLLYEFVTKSGCHGTWPNHDKCMAMELHTWAAVTVMHTVMWVCIVCSLLGMFQAVSANFASPSLDSRPSTFVKWTIYGHFLEIVLEIFLDQFLENYFRRNCMSKSGHFRGWLSPGYSKSGHFRSWLSPESSKSEVHRHWAWFTEMLRFAEFIALSQSFTDFHRCDFGPFDVWSVCFKEHCCFTVFADCSQSLSKKWFTEFGKTLFTVFHFIHRVLFHRVCILIHRDKNVL